MCRSLRIFFTFEFKWAVSMETSIFKNSKNDTSIYCWFIFIWIEDGVYLKYFAMNCDDYKSYALYHATSSLFFVKCQNLIEIPM